MNRRVYTALLKCLAPILWVRMGYRANQTGRNGEVLSAERFGYFPYPLNKDKENVWQAPVWVHAVSLGETRAAQSLLHALLDRGLPVLLTHTTATGRAEGQRLFSAQCSNGQLRQAWLPYDFPGASRRFLQYFAPRLGILIERELWPNLLAAARQQAVPMALVNARFSASSLRQARWLGKALHEAIQGLDLILAQTPVDAHRLRQAGAMHVKVEGNLKFDMHLPINQVTAGATWRITINRPVIAIASTREGEEEMFLSALKAYGPSLNPPAILYILIPRHPERFDSVAQQLQDAQLAFVRRSTQTAPTPHTQVYLGDTLGEMAFYYAAADIVIMGGSFASLGGQNLIEAGMAGTPVIVGPHTFNFEQAASDAIQAGAAWRVPNMQIALQTADALLKNKEKLLAMQQAAKQWTQHHAGATQRTMAALEPWLLRQD